MFDLYGLGHNFPGMPLPPNLDGAGNADVIERAISADSVGGFPELRPDRGFFPYLQVHEYEGLQEQDRKSVV